MRVYPVVNGRVLIVDQGLGYRHVNTAKCIDECRKHR